MAAAVFIAVGPVTESYRGEVILIDSLIDKVLKEEVYCSYGCTEPGAMAYAGALVRKMAPGMVSSARVLVDKKFYKNCMRVTIPKTQLQGAAYAAALGMAGGKPEYRLEAIRGIDSADVAEAKRMVLNNLITVETLDRSELFIEISLRTETGGARCRIENNHCNVTLLERNGKAVEPPDGGKYAQASAHAVNLEAIFDYVKNVPPGHIGFLEDVCETNYNAALEGLNNPGANYFGATMHCHGREKDDFIYTAHYAKVLSSAACDARMNGRALSVMSIAGSGNLGITAVVPIVALSRALDTERHLFLKSAALSLLVTYYIKSKIGVLSSTCGCAVAGGSGISAGIALLEGGTEKQVRAAINNLIGGLAGMICDGAKGGCAFKIAIAAGAAFDAARLALNDVSIQAKDGLVEEAVEKTIENLSYITRKGMEKLDDALFEVICQ